MNFYQLVDSLHGRASRVIDLSTGSPLVFPQLSQIALRELSAPRWIDAERLGAYADYDGIPAFVDLICERWAGTVGRPLQPAEVMVTPGAQGALTVVRQWLRERRRRALYPLGVEFPGAVDREDPAVGRYGSVPTGPARCRVRLPDAAQLDWRDVGAVLLSQPHNPTGAAFQAAELRPLVDAAGRRGAVVVVDRAYSLPEAPLAVQLPELPTDGHVVHVFSFSKVGLASERTGVLIGPEELVSELRMVQRRLFIQSPKIGQALAAAVLEELAADPELGAIVGQAYQERWYELVAAVEGAAADVLAAGLLRIQEWQGGPFLWAELELDSDPWTLAEAAIHAGVAVMPGAGLAAHPSAEPGATVRIGLGTSLRTLREGGSRLGGVLVEHVLRPVR